MLVQMGRLRACISLANFVIMVITQGNFLISFRLRTICVHAKSINQIHSQSWNYYIPTTQHTHTHIYSILTLFTKTKLITNDGPNLPICAIIYCVIVAQWLPYSIHTHLNDSVRPAGIKSTRYRYQSELSVCTPTDFAYPFIIIIY